MESFIKSSKNDSNQIPILEKAGFDSNHRVPNRDSDSALVMTKKFIVRSETVKARKVIKAANERHLLGAHRLFLKSGTS